MSYDENWHENSRDQTLRIVRKTIRHATIEELKQLASERFSPLEFDWLERFNRFLDENPRAKYYHAELPEGADLVFCRDTSRGLWFLAGRGVGKIQPKAAEALDELIDSMD